MKKHFALLLGFLPLAASFGVKTHSVSHTTFEDFVSGEFENVSVSHDGRLNLSSTVEEVAAIDEPIVWAAVADADGNLYLGTGNAGKVVKVARDGEVSTVFSPEEILSRALAVDADGNLYVGTSPIGRVYRIPPEGRPEIYFDPEDTYIWDLTIDPDGNLFVSTGRSARIYKLPPDFRLDDEPVVWFKCEQSHLTTLAWDRDGHLLAGSSPDGILYRVREEGKGFALFDSDSEEIKQVAAGSDGTILFSSFIGKKTGLAAAKVNIGAAKKDDEADNTFVVTASSTGRATVSKSIKKRESGGGSGTVFSLDRNGFVQAYWGLPNANIFSFHEDSSGRLLVGTNDKARIYSIVERGDWRILLQTPDGGEVSLLLPDPNNPDSVLAVTSNPARIYRLGAGAPEDGIFESAVVDASQVARWGSILVEQSGADESDLVVATRTGNTKEPDDTWSDWEELEHAALGGGKPVSPNGRYLQYRISFLSLAERVAYDARVSRVRMFYQTPNTAPVVTDVRIVPVGFQLIDLVTNTPNMDLKKLLDPKNAVQAVPATQMRRQLKASGEDGHMTVAWNVLDSNGDALEYSVAIRLAGDGPWITLAEDIDVPVVSFNSNGFSEGYYQARVVASDLPDNAQDHALTGYRQSDRFLIDNSSPVIEILDTETGGGAVSVKFEVEDAFSVLRAVEYVLDGQPARSLRPDDGLFDALYETFSLELDDIESGTHSLVLKAYDEKGKGGVLTVPLDVD